MKKIMILVAAVFAAVVVLVITMVAVINMKGGVSADHQGLARLPVIGKLIRVNNANPDERTGAGGGPLANDRPLSFLRPGDESKLGALVRELERKSAEYDDMLLQLRRRARELDAWERQIITERDNLKQKFSEQAAEQTQRAALLAQKESDLNALSIAISAQESANLKKTADIYTKMNAAKSGEILVEMYTKGDKDGVIKIISLMDERSAANALAAMNDARICAEITGKLAHVVKTPAGAGQPAEGGPATQPTPPSGLPAGAGAPAPAASPVETGKAAGAASPAAPVAPAGSSTPAAPVGG